MSSEFRRRASLVLNVVLTVTVGVLILHELEGAPAPSAAPVSLGKMTNEVTSVKMASETPVLTEQPQLQQYADFASASDRRRWMIDQLRVMGISNDTLALVARMDLEAQWEGRFQACWGDAHKMGAVQLELDKSKDTEMRAALGDAGFKQWDQKNMLWEAMSTKVDATPAEADAVYDVKKKLQQRLLDLEEATVKGTMDTAQIGAASDAAHAEYNQQLKSLLGDDRYAVSQQLDDAFRADLLRHQLANVNPTDTQFQELFKAQQQWDQSLSQLDQTTPDYAAQYKAMDDARDQTYQQVLGSDVYNTYQEQQHPSYSMMKKYENLWGLDDGKIDYVYNTMKNYEKSIQDYQSQVSASQAQGQNVDSATVNQKLQQITDQTGQALQNHLGSYSFNKLQRNHLFQFNQTQSSQ